MYDDELNFKTGLPLFGIGILSIPDAARLLVIDMWNNGDVDSKKLPHIESECQNDLIAQTFSSEIAKWQDTIISGISGGSLCTVRITKILKTTLFHTQRTLTMKCFLSGFNRVGITTETI
jgi:hypothetical protein